MTGTTPEQRSRANIDRLLNQADWMVQDMAALNVHDELVKRDKANLDIFWLRDESTEDTANLPPPELSPMKSWRTSAPPWSNSRRLREIWRLGCHDDVQ